MKFEISEILRATDPDGVMDILEAELRTVADRVQRDGSQISAGKIREASFGPMKASRSRPYRLLVYSIPAFWANYRFRLHEPYGYDSRTR